VHDPLQDGGVKLLGQPDCNLLFNPPVTPPEHNMPRVGVKVHSSARTIFSVLLNWISLILFIARVRIYVSREQAVEAIKEAHFMLRWIARMVRTVGAPDFGPLFLH